VIVLEDAILEGHSFYTKLAVGGTLVDSTPAASATVGGSSYVGALDPASNIRWHQGVQVGEGPNQTFPFEWAHFENLAMRLQPGSRLGPGALDSVHVVDHGSNSVTYDTRAFIGNSMPAETQRGVNTLVVFSGTGAVTLRGTPDGRQFQPSVLAPFSTVVLDGNIGYVDGFIIARELRSINDASDVQFHGKAYTGPLFCSDCFHARTIRANPSEAAAIDLGQAPATGSKASVDAMPLPSKGTAAASAKVVPAIAGFGLVERLARAVASPFTSDPALPFVSDLRPDSQQPHLKGAKASNAKDAQASNAKDAQASNANAAHILPEMARSRSPGSTLVTSNLQTALHTGSGAFYSIAALLAAAAIFTVIGVKLVARQDLSFATRVAIADHEVEARESPVSRQPRKGPNQKRAGHPLAFGVGGVKAHRDQQERSRGKYRPLI